jgi:ATP-dependent RNA helicase DDX51/DBP6
MKSKRARILSAFKQDKIDILVCTDALARGIDIGQIDFVVSYDCPKFVKTYIHRVGRTARAGKTGSAITMVEKSKDQTFKALLSEAGKPLDITEEQVLIKAKEERIYNAALEKSKDILQEEVEAESSKKSSKKPRKMRNNKSNF